MPSMWKAANLRLYVSPSGESMLIDTGYAGNNNRDANRILAAAAAARVKRIDYLVITHYHGDHAGGVPQLAAKIPIGKIFDHGDSLREIERQDSGGVSTLRRATREVSACDTSARRYGSDQGSESRSGRGRRRRDCRAPGRAQASPIRYAPVIRR